MGEWSPAKPSSKERGDDSWADGPDAKGAGGRDVGDTDGEDVIQKFKREMREREAKKNGTYLEEGDTSENGHRRGTEATSDKAAPTSLSIGSFSIPLNQNASNTSTASSASTTVQAPPGLLSSRPPLTSTASQPTIPSAIIASTSASPAASNRQPVQTQSFVLPSAGSGPGLSSSTPTTPFSDPAILSSNQNGGLYEAGGSSALPTPNVPGTGPATGAGRKGGSRFAKFFVDAKGKEIPASTGSAPGVSTGGTGSEAATGGLGTLLAGMGVSDGATAGDTAGGGDAQMNKLLAMLTQSKVSAHLTKLSIEH